MVGPLLLAQLTDTHVLAPGHDGERHVDNNGRLLAAVERLNAERPAMAAVLATGDLTNDGDPAEFAALAEMLDPLDVPVLAIPGNHDDRTLLRSTFPGLPWATAHHASWVVEVDRPDGSPVTVVGLDTTIPGEPGAEFDDERDRWLRSVLRDAGSGPTILAMHHPPFVTGIGWMDRSGFIGLDRFESVVRDHPVDKIVCGHLHRPITSMVAGATAQVGVATVQHVELGLAADAGVELILDPVGYMIHRVDGDAIVTHTRYFDTGVGPFRPEWAAEYESP